MDIKMTTTTILLVVLTIALSAPATSMQLCLPTVCQTILCASVNEAECTHNNQGLYLPNGGGACGRCPICVSYLDEGSRCAVIADSPPTSECRASLVCSPCDNGDKQCSVCKNPKASSIIL